jgi:hypothetical protein
VVTIFNGEKMKLVRTDLVSTLLILALVSLTFPGSSLETDIFMTTGHNLSLDLGPEFMFSKTISKTEGGNFIQTITLNNSTDSGVNASLILFSIPMYRERLNTTNSSAILELMKNMMVGTFLIEGGKVVNETPIRNAWQRNVTAYSISIPKSKEKPNGEELILAGWPIDSMNYVILLSYLDKSVTRKIIETMDVKS